MRVVDHLETGITSLDCDDWINCMYTEPLPTDLEMRRIGAPTLFEGEG